MTYVVDVTVDKPVAHAFRAAAEEQINRMFTFRVIQSVSGSRRDLLVFEVISMPVSFVEACQQTSRHCPGVHTREIGCDEVRVRRAEGSSA